MFLIISSGARGAQWVNKSGNLPIREKFGCDVSVRPPTRPSVQTLREGEGSPKATRRGWRMPSFLGGKSLGAFGQPVFFSTGNRMTLVAFVKEVSLKSLSLFGKTIVRQY